MRIGLALDMGRQDMPLPALVERYRAMLSGVADQPIHSIWLGEAYSDQGQVSGHISSPFIGLAAIASSTPALLGVGVTLLPAWHPARLAYDGAVLDRLTDGRLIIGTGVGREGLWTTFGIPAREVGAYVDRTLVETRRLWTAGVAVPGRPGGPPFWVGGKTKAAVRRAVEVGEAYYAGTSTWLSEMGPIITGYRDRLGPDRPGYVAVNRLAIVAGSRDEAARIAREHLSTWYEAYRSRGLIDSTFDRVVEELALLGSPEDVRDALASYEEMGVDQVNLRIAPVGLPMEHAEETLARICDSGLITYELEKSGGLS